MTPDLPCTGRARAHANIAVAKYWGKRDESRNLPLFDSVAFTVDGLTTETTATWDGDESRDVLVINGWQVPGHQLSRATRILDAIREQTGIVGRCVLHSTNNFPLSAGLASSASGCAAAALAASSAAGLSLSSNELSALARLGSGSASRSIPGGWTRWYAGSAPDGSDSFARTIAPATHWPLHVFVMLVADGPKDVSSTEAMRRCMESPFWDAYAREAASAADAAQDAILQRDFGALSKAMHHNALLLHALALSCHEPICFFAPKSIEILRHVLRTATAAPVCCTLDAGANVVVLCDENVCPFVKNDLTATGIPFLQCRIGEGARVL